MALRTANPALNSKSFEGMPALASGETMTMQGTVNKTGILLLCVFATAAWTWNQFSKSGEVGLSFLVGIIGGLIFGMVTTFKKEWAPVTAPIYALLEGLVLGGFSAYIELRFPGIAMQAAGMTFGTLFCLLLAYRSGLIRATDKFRLGVAAAMGGIALVYFVSMVLGIFGTGIPFIHESGLIGIGFSLFVVGIAALNLVLDFDFIESAANQGVPRYMEWYAAFGLIVTLIWLYVEMLRLLSKLRDRR